MVPEDAERQTGKEQQTRKEGQTRTDDGPAASEAEKSAPVGGYVRKVFPGGNTAYGFFSFYDYIAPPDANKIFVIKGGPGVGKSTFMRKIAEAVRSRGYDVDPDLARNESGHFADDPLAVALHRSGRAPTLDMARQQVRNLYLRRPVELTYQDVREFAQLLRPGEAVFSVAHPGRQELGVSVRLSEDDLRIFVETIPLVALEAHHPYHTSPDVEHYRNLAKRYGLAVTCGSDAHGQNVRRPLRKHPASMCAEFLKIIRERWAARAPVLAARS